MKYRVIFFPIFHVCQKTHHPGPLSCLSLTQKNDYLRSHGRMVPAQETAPGPDACGPGNYCCQGLSASIVFPGWDTQYYTERRNSCPENRSPCVLSLDERFTFVERARLHVGAAVERASIFLPPYIKLSHKSTQKMPVPIKEDILHSISRKDNLWTFSHHDDERSHTVRFSARSTN